MASEPSDDPVSVSLPPDLAEWVDQQAADRDTDRETILVQLLAAHQATEQLENGAEIDADVLARTTDLEDEVREIIASRLSDIAGAAADRIDIDEQVKSALDEQLDDQVTEIVDRELSTALDEKLADAMEEQLRSVLDDRLAEVSQSAAEQATQEMQQEVQSVKSEFVEQVDDVRDRVIQVKKETDRKAPAEHKHPDLVDQINEIASETEAFSGTIEELRDDIVAGLDSQEERLDDLDETVWDMQEKLRTVAYVVRELRENTEIETKRATSVEQIKQAAAGHDIERARCEACGQGVTVALMTAPECPHCEATVNDVEPSDGFFGKAQLVKAQGIEAADTEET